MILNNVDYFNQNNVFTPDFPSLRVRVENAFNDTTQKVVNFVRSPEGQIVIGFGLGLVLSTVTRPLTSRVVTALGLPAASSSFGEPKIPPLIILAILAYLAPRICITGPITAENLFRETLQPSLIHDLQRRFFSLGLPDSIASVAARVTAVVLTSIAFAAIHIPMVAIHALLGNPVGACSLVVNAFCMGVILGLAKELTGELYMSKAMHITNNTKVWAENVWGCLYSIARG